MFYALACFACAAALGRARLLRPFAFAGRMPLSNYLLQTLMASFVFYGWGLGFWGRATPLVEMVLPIALFFVVQLPLSAWWLSRFRYGPVEYLWRRFTYGRRLGGRRVKAEGRSLLGQQCIQSGAAAPPGRGPRC